MSNTGPENPVLRWFSKGIPLGSVAGVSVGLHPLILLLAVFWTLQAFRPAAMLLDLDYFGLIVVDGIFALSFLLAPYIGSLLLHELGHVAALRVLHLAPQGIVLLPLGGGTKTPGGERSPYAEFLAGIAGPIVSLTIALVTTAIWLTLPGDLTESAMRVRMKDVFAQTAFINWLLFSVNVLVPVFPLACARMVRSLLSVNYEPRKTTYDLALMGLLTVGLFLIVAAALHFLPTGSPYLGSSSFLLSLLIACALQGAWDSHSQMRHVQQSEVYSDPEFARSFFESIFPKKSAAQRPARVIPASSSSTSDEEPPATATPVHHRALDSEIAPSQPSVRRPKKVSRPLTPREQLMEELDNAVREEDFLRAAQIRDRIRSLEGQESRTS